MITADRGYRDHDDYSSTVDAAAASAAYRSRDGDRDAIELFEMAHEIELEEREQARQESRRRRWRR